MRSLASKKQFAEKKKFDERKEKTVWRFVGLWLHVGVELQCRHNFVKRFHSVFLIFNFFQRASKVKKKKPKHFLPGKVNFHISFRSFLLKFWCFLINQLEHITKKQVTSNNKEDGWLHDRSVMSCWKCQRHFLCNDLFTHTKMIEKRRKEMRIKES